MIGQPAVPPRRYEANGARTIRWFSNLPIGRQGLVTIEQSGVKFSANDLMSLVRLLFRRSSPLQIAGEDIVAYRLLPVLPAFWKKQARVDLFLSDGTSVCFTLVDPDHVREWLRWFGATEYR